MRSLSLKFHIKSNNALPAKQMPKVCSKFFILKAFQTGWGIFSLMVLIVFMLGRAFVGAQR